MQEKCAEAVSLAAGRKMTKSELDGIESRVRAGMVSIARRDPAAWRAMPFNERVAAGADWAAKQLSYEADLARQRKQLQLAKMIETGDRIDGRLYSNPDQALARGARERALKNDIGQAYNAANGITREYMGPLMHDIETAMKEGQGLIARAFDVDNPGMADDIIREIYRPGSTGNALAKLAGEKISQTLEDMRQRFNAAGGNVARLLYGYVPTLHDRIRILGDGSDAQRARWAQFVFPLLDRSFYLNEFGDPMTDNEVMRMLTGEDRGPWQAQKLAASGKGVPARQAGIWDEITGTAPSELIDEQATRLQANANSQHRALHFRDADAHMAYNREYGEGSLLDAVFGHVDGMARNIALVERYGPNGTRTIRNEIARTAEHDGSQMRNLEKEISAYWEYVNGDSRAPVRPGLAKWFDNARAAVSGVKMQGTAVQAALGDVPTLFTTANIHKLPFFQMMGTAARLMKPGESELHDWLMTKGIISEELIHGGTRFGRQYIASKWAKYLSASTFKLSGLTAWSNATTSAFEATMSRGFAKISGTPWDDLGSYDRDRLSRAGFTQDDWSIVNQAVPDTFEGNAYLTKDSIYATGSPAASRIVPKLLGMLNNESGYAVLTPDLHTKVMTATTPGTWKGELLKSFLQFKSFPIAMVTRHWGRVFELARDYGWRGQNLPSDAPLLANPLAYAAANVVSLTLMGAVITEVKDILMGKDPESAGGDLKHTVSFWGRAFSAGGGAGFAGDMLSSALSSPDFGSFLSSVASGPGPSMAVFQPLHVLSTNVQAAAEGKDTHVGADLFKMGVSDLPLVNLWYWKTVLNRLIWDNIAENLSPGVTQRNINRSNKQYGNDYWWSPGTSSPQRAPDLANAGGQ